MIWFVNIYSITLCVSFRYAPWVDNFSCNLNLRKTKLSVYNTLQCQTLPYSVISPRTPRRSVDCCYCQQGNKPRNISYHDASVCFMVIRRMHAQEPLLAGGVPEICKRRPNQGTTTTLNESTVEPAFLIEFYIINFIFFFLRKEKLKPTNHHRLVFYSSQVLVESQSICWYLLGATGAGLRILSLKRGYEVGCDYYESNKHL